MSLNLSKIKSTSRPVTLIEEGTYPARVVQIIDLGVQRNNFDAAKPPKQKVRVSYELVTEFVEDENGDPDESRPRWVHEEFFLSPMTQEKGTSTKRMKAYDPKGELEGDLTLALGRPCLVTVSTKQKKDKTGSYNIVPTDGVSAPMKGFPVPELVNDPVLFLTDSWDEEIYQSLPEFIRDIIDSRVVADSEEPEASDPADDEGW